MCKLRCFWQEILFGGRRNIGGMAGCERWVERRTFSNLSGLGVNVMVRATKLAFMVASIEIEVDSGLLS